jgi:hypothetical protein
VGSTMKTDTVTRLRHALLVLALVGIAAQVVGRVNVVHAGARAQDVYAMMTALGVVVTSLSGGAAFFIFVRTRVTYAWTTAISLALALCIAFGLMFLGIYWPWMLR